MSLKDNIKSHFKEKIGGELNKLTVDEWKTDVYYKSTYPFAVESKIISLQQQNKTVEYFLDEGNDDVLLSNYINTEQNQINDYSDNMLQQRFTYHDIELDKKLAELNPRPIEKILIGPTEKSATAGFDYYMTYQGTDSIAYGDRYNSHKSTVNGQRYTRAKFENVLLQGDMFSQVSRYYPATGFYIGVNFVDYQNDLINLNKKRASFWDYAGGGS